MGFNLKVRSEEAAAQRIYNAVYSQLQEDLLKIQAKHTDKVIQAYQNFEEQLAVVLDKKVDDALRERKIIK